MNNIFKNFENILLQYISKDSLNELEKNWNKSDRIFYDIGFLNNLIKNIENSYNFKSLSIENKHLLLISSFFSKSIYDPKMDHNYNTEQSVLFFKKSTFNKNLYFILLKIGKVFIFYKFLMNLLISFIGKYLLFLKISFNFSKKEILSFLYSLLFKNLHCNRYNFSLSFKRCKLSMYIL